MNDLPSYAITFLPSLFRGWNGSDFTDYLMARNNWEAVAEGTKAYSCIGMADTTSKNFDENLW
jgi:hypothetical protein